METKLILDIVKIVLTLIGVIGTIFFTLRKMKAKEEEDRKRTLDKLDRETDTKFEKINNTFNEGFNALGREVREEFKVVHKSMSELDKKVTEKLHTHDILFVTKDKEYNEKFETKKR